MERVKKMAVYMLSQRPVSHTNDAVMFDIDDTLLRPYTEEPIPEMIDLLCKARMLGYNIIVITARPNTRGNVTWTREQLHRLGIVPDELFFAPAEKKTQLKDALHYNFVLSIGDMTTDLGGSPYWIKLPDATDPNYIRTNISTYSDTPSTLQSMS